MGIRYSDAVNAAKSRGAGTTLLAFEKVMASSGAVVNCTLPFLRDFATQGKTLYANYHKGVHAGVRKIALQENDQQRTVVDAIMFGSYASSISFAALSLNDRGVESYGEYALKLRTITIADRATILEENSFDFVDHKKLGPKTSIPLGCRSDWDDRGRLAVAKLEPSLDTGPIQSGGFKRLLLSSEGNFKTDHFMEVHIFGTFDFNAVEAISGPVPKRGMDQAIWEAVKEEAKSAGKRVDEW